MKKIEHSTILIVDDIKETLTKLKNFYSPHNIRIIYNEEKSDFLMAQASQTIKEAYIASNEKKYIFLCGKQFGIEPQNALLKILEEPPINIVFILITTSKTSLLPTVYSRLKYQNYKKNTLKEPLELDLKNLDLRNTYLFLKKNNKITKDEAIEITERILSKIFKDKINLTDKQLNCFSKSIKLLKLNSKPINVLTSLMLNLIKN